jgi:hypothetical protein
MDEEPVDPPVDPPPQGEPVEIHAPHAPIHTFRDFLIALGTITAGVLIALSIEAMLEWNHHRTLVREARATIAREMADNLKDVGATLQDVESQQRDVATALRLANELLANGKTDIHKINVGAALADLRSASWETAGRTGALAHMEYDEVRRYAEVYTFQELYSQQQRKALERATAAMAITAYGGDPGRWLRTDLEQFRQQVLALGAEISVQERFGRRLSELYRKALKE